MNRTIAILATGLLSVTIPCRVEADVIGKSASEAAEYVLKKFGKETAEEGAERLAARIETLAVAHGDEAITAVRKVGPKAISLAEKAGENGKQAVQLMARFGDEGMLLASRPKSLKLYAAHGDDAARAMLKHQDIAEPIIESHGAAAVRALEKVSPQNGRRIARMAGEGDLTRIGQTTAILETVGRYGDRAMEFVWKHKAALAVSAALAAFLADPEPFIDGTRDLAQVVGENVVKPLAEAPAAVATEAAKRTNWTLIGVVVIAAVAVCFLVTRLLNRQAMNRAARPSRPQEADRISRPT